MPKGGILHDYDLMANAEPSAADQTCVVCGDSPMFFQWSDYSGEGMCQQCGCPYQLKWGSDKQREEGNYPYLRIREDVLPILREYWNETHKFTCFGIMLGDKPGLAEFNEWAKPKHPELYDDEPEEETAE